MQPAAMLILALSLLAGLSHAQYLATDGQDVARYNNTPYYAGPGGWQNVLYEDQGTDVDTGMVFLEIHLEPCGVGLPQIHHEFTEISYLVSGTIVGTITQPATNAVARETFQAGAIVPVPRSAMHGAENPSCTEPAYFLQTQSGGAAYNQLDILTSVVGMMPSGLQYGMFLPDGQVQASAKLMRPNYSYNTDCLARCGLSPAPSVEGPTPSLETAG